MHKSSLPYQKPLISTHYKAIETVQKYYNLLTVSAIGHIVVITIIIIPYLDLAIGLQEFGDRHLILLQSPLHQFGAAHVDSAVHVGGIVLWEGTAVDDQQAAGTTLQQPGQALDVHGTAAALLPRHGGAGESRRCSSRWDSLAQRRTGAEVWFGKGTAGLITPTARAQTSRLPCCLKKDKGKFKSEKIKPWTKQCYTHALLLAKKRDHHYTQTSFEKWRRQTECKGSLSWTRTFIKEEISKLTAKKTMAASMMLSYRWVCLFVVGFDFCLLARETGTSRGGLI